MKNCKEENKKKYKVLSVKIYSDEYNDDVYKLRIRRGL